MILTRQVKASDAAERWASQYEGYSDQRKQDIGRALRELGPNPSPDAVDAVIGNDSWTRVEQCDGCGAENQPFVIGVGGFYDFYSRNNAWLCGACVDLAKRDADKARGETV